MTTKYDEAVIALYRAPLDKFVAERKRLASELKGAGDKAGATRIAGLGRPPISAWTVNQLWWEARETFDELFAAGERLRAGDLAATSHHREAMTKLRARAETLLAAAGHASTEAMVRRIMTDLSALAAVGTFDPDPPGALAADRDPPGFDAIGLAAQEATPGAAAGKHASTAASKVERSEPRKEADAAQARQERERLERERLEQERRQAEEEKARRRAERTRLEGSLRDAKAELATRSAKVDCLRLELAEAEKAAAQTRTEVADLASRLAALE